MNTFNKTNSKEKNDNYLLDSESYTSSSNSSNLLNLKEKNKKKQSNKNDFSNMDFTDNVDVNNQNELNLCLTLVMSKLQMGFVGLLMFL